MLNKTHKTHILTLVKKFMIKILNLKLGILLKCQNINLFFAKYYVSNWSEELFVIKKTVLWTYIISDFNCKEIVGAFYEKELQKTN